MVSCLKAGNATLTGIGEARKRGVGLSSGGKGGSGLSRPSSGRGKAGLHPSWMARGVGHTASGCACMSDSMEAAREGYGTACTRARDFHAPASWQAASTSSLAWARPTAGLKAVRQPPSRGPDMRVGSKRVPPGSSPALCTCPVAQPGSAPHAALAEEDGREVERAGWRGAAWVMPFLWDVPGRPGISLAGGALWRRGGIRRWNKDQACVCYPWECPARSQCTRPQAAPGHAPCPPPCLLLLGLGTGDGLILPILLL